MENLDRLFRDAERLKPSGGLWNRIAERAGLSSEGRMSEGGRPSEVGRASEGGRRHEWRWRMAASFAVGLGMVAALLILTPGPGRMASRLIPGAGGGNGEIGKAGGAEDFSSEPVATVHGRPDQVLPDEEVLDWHADLGEVMGWDDEVLIADPLVEE